jgi:hypothetical protein
MDPDSTTTATFASLPLLAHEDLPPDVARRISRVEAARAELWRYRVTREGARLDLADGECVFLPDPHGADFAKRRRERWLLAVALLLPFISGVLVLCLCVHSLLGTPLDRVWWVLGAISTLVGAGLVQASERIGYYTPRKPTGLCLTQEGLARLHSPVEPPEARRYQFLPWEQLHELGEASPGEYVARRADGASLALLGEPRAEQVCQLVEAWWRGTRELAYVPPESAPAWFSVKRTAVALLAAGGVLGFFWLVGVVPTKSDEGQLAAQFFESLRAGDAEAAHALLSPDARGRHSPSSLVESLPSEFVEQRWISVNGISGSIGPGASSCVDGSVHVDDERSRRFRIRMAEFDGTLHITSVEADRSCATRR